jgi:hypothetical protein
MGQEIEEMSDLAMSMALEREGQGGWNIGGNILIVLDELLKSSHAEVRLRTRVSGFRREMVQEGKEEWIVEYSADGGEVEYEIFDKVILAAPRNASGLHHTVSSTEEDGLEFSESPEYYSRYITFLTSRTELDPKHFGVSGPLPEQILTVSSPHLRELEGIHEISHLRDFYKIEEGKSATEHLYRILSNQDVLNQVIFGLFDDEGEGITWLYQEKIENAYPMLYPRNTFPQFALGSSLWDTSAVESIGSSIDLSWVAGENVARMVMAEIECQKSSSNRNC